jgi:HlyD family secretion protein
MDIPRGEEVARSKRIRRIVTGVIVVVVVAGTTYALSRLKPAAPTVDRGMIMIDTVKRGELLRQHRGLGTLVPEDTRWIPATTQGRVERRLVLPGTRVTAATIILELSNPELEQTMRDAELQLKAADADFTNLRKQLETELLNLQSQAASVQALYHQAKLQAETDEQLLKDGLVSELNYKRSKLTAEEMEKRNKIEQQRVAVQAESAKARLTAQQAQVDQRRAQYELRKSQVDALKVRAGLDGVLQVLPVEVGQQVAPGTNLARVADPTRLKAEIRIAETQAKDVLIGQKAIVDTRNGVVEGRVVRIDSAVQAGTVTVDVAFTGPLPPGARPDMNVDGTIEIERLQNVLYVGRPVQGQPNSTVGLFKLIEGGREAVRVQVKLGRSSVNTIEVVEGLVEGDQVILSDMSAQDNVDRVRIG